MAWKLLPTDYTDAVWSGLKRYTQVDNSDGTVSFNDVTTYTNKEKSFFGAKDANRMNEALNYIMSMLENGTNLYEEFQTYFTTQKELFKSSGDSSYQELTQYFVNLKAQGDSSLAQIEKTYEEHMTTYEGEQTAAFNTWFAGIKGEFLPTTNFTLHERGKLRRITGEQVQDRIVKHALCDEVLNPLIEPHLIYDNGASVVGKGIAFTRKRLLTHLRKYYAQHGSNEGYILLIDFSKYYDNIRHDVLLKLFEQYIDDEHALWLLRKTVERSRVDVSYMSDEEYEHCLDKLFDSLLYQYMNPKLFTGEKFMGKHLNIGDQVAQTAGISYRIRIDNYVKIVRGVKFYAGYMDDSYAIHESKEFLQELLEDIIEIANELGITVNTRKTRICKLSEHWRFLQVQYSLTDTGRVIQKINPKRLTAMRRKMKKLAPKLTEKEFTDFYKSWFKNHYKIMSKKQRSNMDTLFNQLKEVTKCTLSPLPMAQS